MFLRTCPVAWWGLVHTLIKLSFLGLRSWNLMWTFHIRGWGESNIESYVFWKFLPSYLIWNLTFLSCTRLPKPPYEYTVTLKMANIIFSDTPDNFHHHLRKPKFYILMNIGVPEEARNFLILWAAIHGIPHSNPLRPQCTYFLLGRSQVKVSV